MKKTSTAFSLINLGCNKNLVDSQHLLGKILTSTLGEYYADPYDPAVELVYVNTCGFLSSAREEAQELIHRLRQKGKKVCIMGCALKYRETLDPSSHPFATEHLLS